MSAPVININDYRSRRTISDRFVTASRRRTNREKTIDSEITPEDIKSFMCYRAIWKTYLQSPLSFVLQLAGVIGLVAAIYGVFYLLF